MFYLIYKITNQLNGMFYIGSHKTKNLNDNYMGSGKYLKAAQKKYGVGNFKKEILFIFNNPEDMFLKEAEIVNEDFVKKDCTYNLKIGGFGGWDFVNTKSDIIVKRNIKLSALKSEKLKSDVEYHQRICKIVSQAAKKRKPLSEDDKIKQKQIALNALKIASERNKGKMWITDGMNNKKIDKHLPLPNGWKKGRCGNFVNKRYEKIIAS